MQLVGRRVECNMLEPPLSATYEGHGASLVLRGDPGVGKSALLEFAVDSAPGFWVLRTCGVEAEIELPFAALHQLARPSSIGPPNCLPRNRPPSKSPSDSATGRPQGGSSSAWPC